MAYAASFPESNCVLDEENLPENVEPLVALSGKLDGEHVLVSCWKLTQEELDEVNKTGRLWLLILHKQMPAASILGISPVPFVKPVDP